MQRPASAFDSLARAHEPAIQDFSCNFRYFCKLRLRKFGELGEMFSV